MVIASKYLVPKGYAGMAIFPFILVGDKNDINPTFLNHERMHLRQQLELLILLFYLWYVLEYLFRLIQYKNHDLAYRNISFEREAYANERNPDYLTTRSFWRFTKHLRTQR
ncbi:hypothetical protein AM493_18400 [Flavobacterium akiainvivens]|uniref:DUF4157 domain-containing protein n=1 Tax=Flavobacterium akiainvivens TaxID=1202724 RepID=A0A0M9VK26_9FLAO|nr:hypothetical protein [Flavobacterium akiainvivens]KOS08416.1 hypothetical protein AM493_18400 [Flavobacterium akiainvivens]